MNNKKKKQYKNYIGSLPKRASHWPSIAYIEAGDTEHRNDDKPIFYTHDPHARRSFRGIGL